MSISLSAMEARCLAIASQGFGPRPARPSIGHLRKLAAQLYAFQIDSEKLLVRAHYVPAFARLGPYPIDAFDSLAYRKRELFEYWGHAACLLPVCPKCPEGAERISRARTGRAPCCPGTGRRVKAIAIVARSRMDRGIRARRHRQETEPELEERRSQVSLRFAAGHCRAGNDFSRFNLYPVFREPLA